MTLAKAIRIAAVGFEGKVDKGGVPYICHCLWVMDRMHTVDEKIVAVLHDAIEDQIISVRELREEGFSESIIDDLKLLTHDKMVPYMSYIRTLSNSPRARKVKMADLQHNSDITRIKGLRKVDFERMEKYHTAYMYLLDK